MQLAVTSPACKRRLSHSVRSPWRCSNQREPRRRPRRPRPSRPRPSQPQRRAPTLALLPMSWKTDSRPMASSWRARPSATQGCRCWAAWRPTRRCRQACPTSCERRQRAGAPREACAVCRRRRRLLDSSAAAAALAACRWRTCSWAAPHAARLQLCRQGGLQHPLRLPARLPPDRRRPARLPAPPPLLQARDQHARGADHAPPVHPRRQPPAGADLPAAGQHGPAAAGERGALGSCGCFGRSPSSLERKELC